MRLLYFVKEHNLKRAPSQRFGELSAFVVAYVARLSADQARHGVLFRKLAHIDAHDGVALPKDELRKDFDQLGLTHPGGAQKKKASHGAAVVKTGQNRGVRRHKRFQ